MFFKLEVRKCKMIPVNSIAKLPSFFMRLTGICDYPYQTNIRKFTTLLDFNILRKGVKHDCMRRVLIQCHKINFVSAAFETKLRTRSKIQPDSPVYNVLKPET